MSFVLMRHLDQMQAFSRIAEIHFYYRGACRLVGLDENMAPCGWMLRVSKPKVEKEKTVPVTMMFCMQVKLDESVAAKLSEFPAPLFLGFCLLVTI